MEELRQRHFQSSKRVVGNNQHDVNVSTTNENKMWVSKSKSKSKTSESWHSYYEPSSRKERLKVTKSKHTSWWNDPERKRKRRVAKYKLYAAEGRFKHSIKKGFRWFKIKWIKIITNI